MAQKTLYVSDLDGTLLLPDATLSAFTAETVRALTAEGMLFSYATARSWLTARKVTAALGALHLPVIVHNGASIVDAADGRVLQALYFTEAEKTFLFETLFEAGPSPMGYSRRGGGTSSHDEHVAVCTDRASRGLLAYLDSRRGDERFSETPREHLGDGRVYYFTCIVDDRREAEAAYRKVAEDGRFTVDLQHDIYSDCWYFEIMPKDATKANAAKRLAAMYGCGRIVCFGDGENDLSLFREADACYAVANGAGALKRAATAVIGPNTEDGTAKKLLELWKKEKEGNR